MPTESVVVITGTSSGFGYDTARLLAAAGHHVFGTMRDVATRNAEPARKLAALGITPIELDITDQHSVDLGTANVLEAAGHIDTLINNAGVAYLGATEAYTPESIERQLATNVIGPFRMARAFLPSMRKNRKGLVIFVSSVAGRLVIPFGGPYTASKWAIEGLAESFSYELRPFGIEVAIVEPSSYATNILKANVGPDDLERLAGYDEIVSTIKSVHDGFESSAGDASEVSRAIAALVATPVGTRPLRTSVPFDSPSESINEATAPIQRAVLTAFGLGNLLPLVPSAV